MGYLKDTVRGVSWVAAFRVTNRLVVFAKTAILARLLLPVQFGVFGIAMIALGLLEILTETGINIFLVQEKADIEEYVSTAWIVSIVRGVLISILLLASAGFVAKFFNSPESLPVLLWMSIVPFLRGFINPAVAKLQKELAFDREFRLKFASFVIESVVSVALALATRSVFAFVWGLIAGVIVELILSWVFIKPRPKFVFEKVKARRVIERGKWVTGASIFNFLFQNGDNITVGKLLGEGQLGIYNVAYKISSLPISEIADVVGRVTFPVYVKIGRDYRRIKEAFSRTVLISTALILAIGLFIFVFAKEIVLLVLGANWQAAIPVLKILSVFGIIKGISNTAMALFLAVGKQEYVAIVTLIGIIGLALPIIPLTLKYGILGTGYAVIIGSLATIPPAIYFVRKVFISLKQSS